jgi:hypothetical protein
VKVPPFVFLVLSSNQDFAMLNSLILFNFYKEIRKNTNNNASRHVKIAEYYSKLLYDYPQFFLIEINNICDFKKNPNLYAMDDEIAILSLTNRKDIEKDACQPNGLFPELPDSPFMLHVVKKENRTLHSYNYQYISVDLKL